ncbi:MAG: EpsG family protein [Capnocytophaga felis]|nr:EpsG family protein [Capnocytophaga felis]
MNMKKIGLNIINTSLFLVSPFLAIPSIILGVIKKDKYSIGLFVALVSLLSYLYIPNDSNDKTRYIEIYEDFKNWDYGPFIDFYYSHSQDFILQVIVKYASEIGVKIQVVYFLVTAIIMGTILRIWKNLSQYLKDDFISILLIITSISYLDTFSGTRFMFAASLTIYAYYLDFFENKKIQPYLWLLIAINIHFSVLVFALAFIVLKFLTNYPRLLKLFFIGSFIFLLLPKSFLFNIFSMLDLGGGLAVKSDSYIASDRDFAENYFKQAGSSGVIIYLAQVMWIFGMYVYMLLRLKSKQKYHLALFFVIGVMNVFYPVTTVFLRYSLLVKILFAIILILDIKNEKIKKAPVLFLGLFSLNIITQLIIMRYNIAASYHKDTFMFLDILLQEPITTNDVIF